MIFQSEARTPKMLQNFEKSSKMPKKIEYMSCSTCLKTPIFRLIPGKKPDPSLVVGKSGKYFLGFSEHFFCTELPKWSSKSNNKKGHLAPQNVDPVN